MNKQTLLYVSVAALVLLVAGRALSNSTGTILSGVGGLASLGAWIGGMIKMAQLKRWGWFVGVLLFTPLSTLIYGIVGPDTSK